MSYYNESTIIYCEGGLCESRNGSCALDAAYAFGDNLKPLGHMITSYNGKFCRYDKADGKCEAAIIVRWREPEDDGTGNKIVF